MKSLFAKIFFGYLAIALLVGIVWVDFSYNIMKNNYHDSIVRNLISLNKTMSDEILPLINDHKTQSLDSLVKYVGKKISIRITVIDSKGNVLADSQKDPAKMENHITRPEFQQAQNSNYGMSIRHSYTISKDLLYVAVPLRTGNEIVGFSRFSLPIEDIESINTSVLMKLIFGLTMIVFILFIFAFIFSKMITKPLKELVWATERVGLGDFHLRTYISRSDELGKLSRSFNSMTGQIENLFNDLKSQKDELHTIISSLQEGLVVLDKDGKIILFNRNFGQMVGNQDISGKFYWEVMRDDNVFKMIKKMFNTNEHHVLQVPYRDKFYLVSINQINTKKELALVFYDISEIKKLEEIKKEFIVNVSHELKTPLTVINGYIETIEETINPENKEYLEIIRNHTTRLISIVQDLLILSSLEDRSTKLELEEVDLNSFLIRIRSTFAQKLETSGLNFNVNIETGLNHIRADEFKLEQLFINLIDNAIKYTTSGSISINLKSDVNEIVIEFIDTGIGIPEADKERVFERFYTVDKSRSRNLSGTGLGLSIVKHIVMLHKGRITLESNLGKGSKFIVILPK